MEDIETRFTPIRIGDFEIFAPDLSRDARHVGCARRIVVAVQLKDAVLLVYGIFNYSRVIWLKVCENFALM